MKRSFIIIGTLLLCTAVSAQTTSQEFKAKYERQVKSVGVDGVGVEYILDKWAEAFPDDPDMLEDRFVYYLGKSQYTEAVPKKLDKYLGQKPVVSLNDSTGAKVNYFQETMFVDSVFAKSISAIDKAISLRPLEIAYKLDKINALIAYEKESPDLACAQILSLIDYDKSAKPSWTYYGEAVDAASFDLTIQEYCYTFFQLGMPLTYEAFKTISEKMLKYNPKSTSYLNNIGSYWLVARKDDRQALKYYNKVLKIDPKDYSAAKNCVVIARKQKNVKMEKKYLPALIEASDSETEKASCRARLNSL